MASDPKLQALANHINARLAQPTLPQAPPLGTSVNQIQGLTGAPPSLGQALQGPPAGTTSLPLASTTSVPAALNQGGASGGSMEGYFQQESKAIIDQQQRAQHQRAGYPSGTPGSNGIDSEGPSKKKVLLMGVYVGGAVFLISFIILVAIRPRFVMKKVKKENGTEELKCNFLAIFLISLTLLVIVLATAGISAAKLGK